MIRAKVLTELISSMHSKLVIKTSGEIVKTLD